jgi:Kef-type K+ transport system membrane component KefB
VFFALAGSKLDINVLFTSLLPVGIIAVVRASSFYMGAKIACKLSNAPEVISKYAWFGLVPQAGLALALALVLKNTLPSVGFDQAAGDTAAVILFGVVGFNECVAPIILRIMLIRSGEAGKKEGVDFAAGGH